ncbi:hypothetical protein ACHAWU_009052 [Discostella pseudostelligera]|uniref:Uncharacterized protein n=1 Tax=Discostella pseudostelligera TaxID=259834 RepID=A0ABD3MIA5_9STRA
MLGGSYSEERRGCLLSPVTKANPTRCTYFGTSIIQYSVQFLPYPTTRTQHSKAEQQLIKMPRRTVEFGVSVAATTTKTAPL